VAAIVGLIFSLVGVVLLFWYALPIQLPKGPRPITDEGQPGSAEQWVLYNSLSHLGLALVIVGTALEAFPSICVIRLTRAARLPRPGGTRTAAQAEAAPNSGNRQDGP
jgi:drug/metabolite transporter (DMT)-like permease